MTRDEYEQADIIRRLEFWINLPQGATLDPSWNDMNRWDQYVREICAHAKAEIEAHRATIKQLSAICGVATPKGEDLDDIKRRVHPGRSVSRPET